MHANRTGRKSSVCGALALGVVSCQSGSLGLTSQKNLEGAEGAAGAGHVAQAATPESPLALGAVEILSRDPRGRTRMLLQRRALGAQSQRLERDAAARWQMSQLAAELGISASALSHSALSRSHELTGGGSILELQQSVRGLELFHARASVVMDANQEVVSVSSQLASDLPESAPGDFALTPEAALAELYTLQTGVKLSAAAVRQRDAGATDPASFVRYDITRAADDRAPAVLEAIAKRVYFPGDDDDGKLIPAYHVELLLRDPRGNNHGFGAVLDARAALDAPVLWSTELTAHEAFSYRVWAEPEGNHTPTDGPLLDATPYPGAAPDRKRPDFRPSSIVVSVEGFNHNPLGMPDPWLKSDATATLGNNVTAYTDRDAYVSSRGLPRRDGFDANDVRADVTSSRTFDYVYDVTRAPDADATQLKAAVTQVFYVTNWLHDFWYDSGFNEAAGNAQQDNYGRGGVGGDPLRAEAQDSADSGAANNANMSTLSDGTSPRMQMYVWSGLPVRSIVTQPALSFEDELGAASYGPQTFDLSGELALVDDGSEAVSADVSVPKGSTTDGCQSYKSSGARIAVVDRGGCTFVTKAQNAQASGAKALLVLDNAPGHSSANPAVEDPPDVSIPMLVVSYEDGQKLRAALRASTTETPLQATRFYRGAETQRDGTIDNTVVAHEWGHYMHHRLVSCNSLSCSGMSEGWADFIALMMVVRDGDSFDGQVYPLSQYASGGLNQSSGYFGTRRAPYSVDMNKNPFTFRHIRAAEKAPMGVPLVPTSADMNEVHNVGEVWAAMLFEAYVNVLQAGKAAGRSFAESQRRMADYVVAGMKAAPVDPTFVEQRDAILAAVQAMARGDASRQVDHDAIALGFAKRGLGAAAVAPPARSTTLNEAVESFTAGSSLRAPSNATPPAAR